MSNTETTNTASDSPQEWSGHPVNVRFSLPFFTRRFYFTMVAGGEQRSHARITEDRAKHPVLTISNLLFGCGVSTLFAFFALVALAMQSAIIEF